MVRLSPVKLAAISSPWLAWNAQWLTIAPIFIPQAITALSTSHRELWSGLVVGGGAVVALVVSPLAGAFSDRSRYLRGRRRPYLVSGVLAGCLALILLGWAESASLAALASAYLLLQFWWNWGAGPFAGLIPDVVPVGQTAEASGWLNALGIVGAILGSTAMFTYGPGQPWVVIAFWVGLSLICLGVTLRFVREPAPQPPPPWPGMVAFARSFYLPPAQNRDFYLVLVTRLLNNMGVWSVATFLVLYLQFVVGLPGPRALQLMAALTAAGALLGIGASLAAAGLIRRFGVVRTVQRSSWVMALTALSYTGIAFVPHLLLVIPVVLVFGIAYAVFGVSDWALALAVLPSGKDAGKDFGIWHVCMVLPQVVGPITTGVLITVVERAGSARLAYGLAFAVAAAWFIVASVYVGRLRLDRPAAPTDAEQ